MKQSQNYTNLSKNAKQFKALLGLDLEYFDYFNLCFKNQLDIYHIESTILGEPSKRLTPTRKNSNFEGSEGKLYFVFMLLKKTTPYNKL